MKFQWDRRHGSRVMVVKSTPLVPNLDRAAVDAAIEQARGTMGEIVQDARQFRMQSQARLKTISDQALRESVGASGKTRNWSQPVSHTPAGTGDSTDASGSVAAGAPNTTI